MNKPDVLVVAPLFSGVAKHIETICTLHHYNKVGIPAELAPKIRALITSGAAGVPTHIIEALPALEVIAINGVGYDAIDLEVVKRRGIRITITAHITAGDVADLAMGLLLCAARRIKDAHDFICSGQWEHNIFPASTKVAGKKAGIIGLGEIGSAIAQRAAGFDMQIAYTAKEEVSNSPYPYYTSLKDLASFSDFLIVAAQGGAETHHLVSREVIENIGPHGVLVNIARGSVVDQEALINALKTGALGAAGLDVFDNEPHVPEALCALPNVVMTPHQGSHTMETRQAMGELIFKNLQAYFNGQPLVTPLTLP